MNTVSDASGSTEAIADANLTQGEDPASIPGERGPSMLHRARSLQSRIANVFALTLLSALAVGLLGWYYVHTYESRVTVQRSARAAVRAQAAGDAPLPTLGPITPPHPLLAKILGPPPAALPASMVAATPTTLPADPVGAPPTPAAPTARTALPPPTPAQIAFERRLSGPAFSSAPDSTSGVAPAGGTSANVSPAVSGGAPPAVGEASNGTPLIRPVDGDRSSEGLGALLIPTVTRTVQAEVLPSERLVLPKGAFIDCTLETAIDSTLPGMTTCVTATDTFGADGTTVLLERGTKLVGETRGTVEQGVSRVFVLWSEARTPTGVIVPLASPGTDALGRSGLAGHVNRHFWQRFGAAMLVSVIDGAVQSAVASQGNGAVIINPSTSQDVLTEVLKGTINIPPTITVNQGTRIQVLVALNIDFRSVYELRTRKP